MGVFKQARKASQIQKEWERLYDAPGAYRPDREEAARAFSEPGTALSHLSDVANRVGLTAGDAGLIGVEVVKQVDLLRDPDRAITKVVDSVHAGGLKTVAGKPMRQFASLAGVGLVAASAISLARPEASVEFQEMDPGMAKLKAYVESLG